MAYSGSVPIAAWGTTFAAMGFMASIQLFVVGKSDAVGSAMLWAVLGCASFGLAQMAYKRIRGDITFGVGSSIERWRAWALFAASTLWVVISVRMAWTNS